DGTTNGFNGTLGADSNAGADDPSWTTSGASFFGIRDTNLNGLDGEPNAGFPSGDGTAGGDFNATFTVASPPLQITNMSITPGSTIGPPASIDITFSGNIDPTAVNNST